MRMPWMSAILAMLTAAAVDAQGLPERYSYAGVPYETTKLPAAHALGDFPFLTLPDGYHYINNPQARDLDRFPFWTKKGFHPVEGRLFMAYVRAVPGKAYSQYELAKRLSDEIVGLGGVAVANERIPNGIAHSMPTDIYADKSVGLGDIYNNPVATWVLHRPEGDVWVHFTTSGSGASLAVMEAGRG